MSTTPNGGQSPPDQGPHVIHIASNPGSTIRNVGNNFAGMTIANGRVINGASVRDTVTDYDIWPPTGTITMNVGWPSFGNVTPTTITFIETADHARLAQDLEEAARDFEEAAKAMEEAFGPQSQPAIQFKRAMREAKKAVEQARFEADKAAGRL